MDGWINKPGYPIVHVKKVDFGFELSQERFLVSGNEQETWNIPINYLSQKGEGRIVLSGMHDIIAVDSKWIKLNYGQSGFYRVGYEYHLIEEIVDRIKSGELNGIDAWGIENDLFTISRMGDAKVSDYLTFVDRISGAASYPANADIVSNLSFLYNIGYGTTFEMDVGNLISKLNSDIVSRLGFKPRTGEEAIDTSLRNSALSGLGIVRDAQAISIANEAFEKLVNKGIAIDPNIANRVYALVARTGGMDEFELLKNMYMHEEDQTNKISLLGALGHFSDLPIANKALDFSQSKHVRMQDDYVISRRMSSENPEAIKVLLDWTVENWGFLVRKFGKDSEGEKESNMLTLYVANLSCINNEIDRDLIVSAIRGAGGASENVRKELENSVGTINLNIKLVKANQ